MNKMNKAAEAEKAFRKMRYNSNDFEGWINRPFQARLQRNEKHPNDLMFVTSLQTPEEYYKSKERLLGQYFAPILSDITYRRFSHLLSLLDPSDKGIYLNECFHQITEQLEEKLAQYERHASQVSSSDLQNKFED